MRFKKLWGDIGGGRKEVSNEYWWTKLQRKMKLSCDMKSEYFFYYRANGNFTQLNLSKVFALIKIKMKWGQIWYGNQFSSFKNFFTLAMILWKFIHHLFKYLPSLSITMRVSFSQAAYKLSWSIFFYHNVHWKALHRRYWALHEKKIHALKVQGAFLRRLLVFDLLCQRFNK